MSLNFPNVSRSYDERRGGVRFWGYDGAREIGFLVELNAFLRLNASSGLDEAGSLSAFDRYRDRILAVATRLYARQRSNFCVLLASDFQESVSDAWLTLGACGVLSDDVKIMCCGRTSQRSGVSRFRG